MAFPWHYLVPPCPTLRCLNIPVKHYYQNSGCAPGWSGHCVHILQYWPSQPPAIWQRFHRNWQPGALHFLIVCSLFQWWHFLQEPLWPELVDILEVGNLTEVISGNISIGHRLDLTPLWVVYRSPTLIAKGTRNRQVYTLKLGEDCCDSQHLTAKGSTKYARDFMGWHHYISHWTAHAVHRDPDASDAIITHFCFR